MTVQADTPIDVTVLARYYTDGKRLLEVADPAFKNSYVRLHDAAGTTITLVDPRQLGKQFRPVRSDT